MYLYILDDNRLAQIGENIEPRFNESWTYEAQRTCATLIEKKKNIDIFCISVIMSFP